MQNLAQTRNLGQLQENHNLAEKFLTEPKKMNNYKYLYIHN